MYTEFKQEDINIKEEIDDRFEIGMNDLVPKRSYYECITCEATFTKSEKLKNHEDIHKVKKSKGTFFQSIL